MGGPHSAGPWPDRTGLWGVGDQLCYGVTGAGADGVGRVGGGPRTPIRALLANMTSPKAAVQVVSTFGSSTAQRQQICMINPSYHSLYQGSTVAPGT